MLEFATPDTAIRITVIGKAGIGKSAAVVDFNDKPLARLFNFGVGCWVNKFLGVGALVWG